MFGDLIHCVVKQAKIGISIDMVRVCKLFTAIREEVHSLWILRTAKFFPVRDNGLYTVRSGRQARKSLADPLPRIRRKKGKGGVS